MAIRNKLPDYYKSNSTMCNEDEMTENVDCIYYTLGEYIAISTTAQKGQSFLAKKGCKISISSGIRKLQRMAITSRAKNTLDKKR